MDLQIWQQECENLTNTWSMFCCSFVLHMCFCACVRVGACRPLMKMFLEGRNPPSNSITSTFSPQNASDRCGGDRRPLHGGDHGSECGRVPPAEEHQEEESPPPLPGDRGEKESRRRNQAYGCSTRKLWLPTGDIKIWNCFLRGFVKIKLPWSFDGWLREWQTVFRTHI